MELPVTFGIEVEFEDGDRAAITADLRRAHLFGWRVKPDSSCGHELITPILGSYEDFDKLSTALEILKRHGARISTRCGLHVHYGMQAYSFDQVRRVLGFFARHEDTMFSLVDFSRRDNRYCKRLTNADEVVKSGSDAWSDDFRHSWINGQAHRRHNTVELRLLEGTLDLDTIRGWTFLGMAMVVAAATRGVRVRGGTGLIGLLVSCGCYRLRGRDPETYQIVAKDWALSAYRLWTTVATADAADYEEVTVREAVQRYNVDWTRDDDQTTLTVRDSSGQTSLVAQIARAQAMVEAAQAQRYLFRGTAATTPTWSPVNFSDFESTYSTVTSVVHDAVTMEVSASAD